MSTSYLASKLLTYLFRLHLNYQSAGESRLANLIGGSRYLLIEDTAYDNLNGGMNGHDIIFFLPIELLNSVGLDELPSVTQRLRDDLNKLSHGVENEWFNAVRLELNDEIDLEFQRAIPFSKKQQVNPDAVEFWKPGLLRLFISHRNDHKKVARDLSDALESYGVSCFVAHDTIQPMSEWRHEIIKGLETMEVMLLYVTDDFDKSYWCQQEVGYALCKGVPIISLKLGHSDPPGFISHMQALSGRADLPSVSAEGIFLLIGKALGQQTRLQDALVNSLIESPDFTETKRRFDRLVTVAKTLTETQLQRLIEGFKTNDQLFNAGHLVSKYRRLCNYLESATGRPFVCEGREIREQSSKDIRLLQLVHSFQNFMIYIGHVTASSKTSTLSIL